METHSDLYDEERRKGNTIKAIVRLSRLRIEIVCVCVCVFAPYAGMWQYEGHTGVQQQQQQVMLGI